MPGAVAGFEPNDILLGITAVLDQIREGKPRVSTRIRDGSSIPRGNPVASSRDGGVLDPRDALWRGLGRIPRSGLVLKEPYRRF